MIRFVLKSALIVGIAATVLPLATGSNLKDAPRVDLFGLAAGVSQAASDLGGFCQRAPQACTAAGEVAAFAADRIEAGLVVGYDYLNALVEPKPEAAATAEPSTVAEAEPDPVLTGAVEAFGPPRPYMPPRPHAAEAAAFVAIPTPAPRT